MGPTVDELGALLSNAFRDSCVPVLDLRPEEKYRVLRLKGSVNIPLDLLLSRLFLLPDRDVRYGVIMPSADDYELHEHAEDGKQQPGTQADPASSEQHAAGSRGSTARPRAIPQSGHLQAAGQPCKVWLKGYTDVRPFFHERGWTESVFCLVDNPELWIAAEKQGLAEREGNLSTLRKRWMFQPAQLLGQEIQRIEAALVAQHTAAHGSASSIASSSSQDASGSSGPAVCPPFKMLDIGCGSGRDLAWLATRERPASILVPISDLSLSGPLWQVHGVDSWLGALLRAKELLQLAAVPAYTHARLYFAAVDSTTGLMHAPEEASLGAKDRAALRRATSWQEDSQQAQARTSPCTHHMQHQGKQEERSLPGQGAEMHSHASSNLRSDSTASSLAQHTSSSGHSQGLLAGGTPPATARMQQQPFSASNKLGYLLAGPPPLHEQGAYDLLLCSRFLERSFFPHMVNMLRPGGFILYSTFIDLSGTRAFGRPSGAEHLLQRHELLDCWFGTQQGFEVLRDDVHVLQDGREVSMYVARKLPQHTMHL